MQRYRVVNIFLLFFFFISIVSYGQLKDIGVPDIMNVSKREYNASAQNWGVAQSSKNFMYFANSDGLLEFDGAHWQLYPLPNRSTIRSLKIDENDRIYLGQQNGFGYMEPGPGGQLQYHSLLELVPAAFRNFDEVWKIHLTSFGVVFQSYSHLFIYKNGQISSVHLNNRIRFSFYVNGKLWVQDELEGLHEYRQGQLFKLTGVDFLNDKEIWAVLPVYNNRVLIGTANDGVFEYNGETLSPWKGEANDFLKENQIFSATKFRDACYAFGTIQNGLLITDEAGKIIQHVNKNKGLQNNTILSIGTDHDQNLWLGLDNGIDYIDISSPFTFIYDPEGLGATYTSLVHNGKLYAGTNHGLFVKDWPEKAKIESKGFRLIPGTVGQVWYLGVHQGVLLCGHDNGAYIVEGEEARLISSVNGGWMFIEAPQNNNFLIGGNYNGLTLFRKSADQTSWRFVSRIKGFDESSKLLAWDKDGNIWMSHGFKGVYKIQLNEKLDSVVNYSYYNSKNGLPADIYNNLMALGQTVVITTPDGVYIFNESMNGFERSVYYNNLFGEGNNVEYILQDQYLNIWFIANGVPGVLRFQEDGTYTRVIAPFEKLSGRLIPGFQHIHIADLQNTFIAMEDGLAHYTPSYQSSPETPFNTYIRQVVNLYDEKTFYPALIPAILPDDSLTFHFKGNNLKFIYSSPDYKNSKKISYSYFLENYSTDWSSWSTESTCEFMNLREGDYIFKVKATDPFKNESSIASFAFTIRPPWYRSIAAYALYTFSVLIFIGLLIWWVYHRMQVSKRKERLKNLQEYRLKVQQYQREALMSEKEIIKLKNEHLQGKMIHLDKELANQTMSLVQKNKFMAKLKAELKNLQNQAGDSVLKSKISLIINRIDKEFDDKKQKELFETYFDEVHEDFFKRLTERYPSLTPREQKLCAYIKMNISTKEIAALQNVTTRGIEISRYRLRKKLELDREANLGAFISSI